MPKLTLHSEDNCHSIFIKKRATTYLLLYRTGYVLANLPIEQQLYINKYSFVKRKEANKAAGSLEIISAMNKQFEQLNDKFTNLADEFSSFKSEILALVSAKSSEIECLKKEMTMLKKHVTKLEGSIDDQNAYDRRDCVILSGESVPLVTQGEICTKIVMDLVK